MKGNQKDYEFNFNPALTVYLHTQLFEIDLKFALKEPRYSSIILTALPTTDLQMEIKEKSGKICGVMTLYF